MKRIWASQPSPAIIIAVLALVAALAGTAVAGPEASTSAITKKKVTKIAIKESNKAIEQRESSLRVAHAETANTAATADSAISADTATTAGNVSNQLWAIVNADGTLFRASPGIVNSVRDAGGQYVVTADRNLANCFFQATLGGNTLNEGLTGDISVNPINGNPNALFVRTGDNSNSNSDRAFTTLIRC